MDGFKRTWTALLAALALFSEGDLYRRILNPFFRARA